LPSIQAYYNYYAFGGLQPIDIMKVEVLTALVLTGRKKMIIGWGMELIIMATYWEYPTRLGIE